MVEPFYSEDGIQLFHGDCREVLPLLGRPDLILTDPPYGERTHAGMRNGHGENSINFDSMTADELCVIFALNPPKRWLISSIDWRVAAELEAEPPVGLEFVRLGVWVKRNPMPQLTGDRPAMGWEGIALAAVYFYCSRDPKRHRAVFWLALVQTVAMAVSQVYHLFITADFTIESVLIPLAGSLFLAFLVCANVFQPRPEENTPVERVE